VNIMFDHIDVFPVRIHPQHLETITSGLIRVCEENRIGTTAALSALAFPRQDRTIAAGMMDYPLNASNGALANVTRAMGIAEDSVLRMTMYHLGHKFGYAIDEAPRAFLAGSLAPHLRYCPPCVAAHGYYSLSWRFLVLTGCPTHGCRLRDRCGTCGATIRLLPQRLRLGVCPACGHDLRHDPTETMTEAEAEEAWLTWRELEFLVTPHPDEDTPGRFHDVYAKGYLVERLRGKITAPQAAEALGLPVPTVQVLERSGSGTLARHLAYARYLGTTLDALYVSTSSGMALDVAPQTLRHAGHAVAPLRDRYEADMVARLREARDRLRHHSHVVTRAAILREAGLRSSAIVTHKPVQSYLQSFPRQGADDDVIACVEVAIAELRGAERRVTIRAVAGRIRISTSHLRTRATAVSLLAAHGCRDEAHVAGEDDLLRSAREAHAGLLGGPLPPSVADIGVAVGVHYQTLNYYPQVKAFLETVAAARREAKWAAKEHQGVAVLARVEDVVRCWNDPTPMTSVDDVAQRVGIPLRRLRSYPGVTAVLDTVTVRLRAQRTHARQEEARQRDEHWLARVEDALIVLGQAGRRPTTTAVARYLGVASATLKKQPRTSERLRRIA